MRQEEFPKNSVRVLTIFLTALLGSLFSVSSAYAQCGYCYSGGLAPQVNMTKVIMTPQNAAVASATRGDNSQTGDSVASASSYSADSLEESRFYDRSDFAFTSDPAIRQRVTDNFISRLETESPEDAAMMRSLEIFPMLEGALQQYGMSTDNFSDALTAYMISVWDLANQTESQISPVLGKKLHDQVLGALSQVTIAGLNDPEFVQEQSDTLLLQAYFTSSVNATLRQQDNAAEYAQISRQAANMSEETFGIDFRELASPKTGSSPKIRGNISGSSNFPARSLIPRDVAYYLE